jgi:hypothetical protein
VRQTIPLPLLVLLLSVVSGCVRQTTREFLPAEEPIEPVSEPMESRTVELAADQPIDGPPPADTVRPPAPPAPHPPEPALFRLGAGYGILGQIDLTACRNQGLQAGYLHMKVTFEDSGRVVRAAVQSPTAPPPLALACIGDQLRTAMVPVFAGGDVTLSKSFFVN